MTYRVTYNGWDVPYAFDFIGKPPSKWTNTDRELVQKYDIVLKLMMTMDQQILLQKEEISRLKHENEFMLRLINERIKE